MPAKTISVSNESADRIHLIVEPVADTYELGAGEGLTLRFDEEIDTPAIEFVFHGKTSVGIWTHAMTEAYRDDALISPN